MNPTLIGLFSVIVWGVALPVARVIEEKIGLFGTMGIVFGVTALFGIANELRLRRRPAHYKAFFRRPLFYCRWLFFVMHEGLLVVAIYIVQRDHMPFIILINYLWPTSIIICSVLFAGVRITRWWAFICGSLVVIGSMAIEVVGPHGFSSTLFSNATDCLAYLMVFCGAISWGLYCSLSRRAGDAAGGSAVTPLFQMTLGLVLPLSFLPHFNTWGNLSALDGLLLAGYCVLQFLAFFAWDHSIRHGNIVILSLFSDFIPWLSLLTASIMLGVGIGEKTIFSAISLVAGAMVTRYGTLQKKVPLVPYEQPEI